MHNYWMSVSHLLPAYIFDMALRLIGKKPMFVVGVPFPVLCGCSVSAVMLYVAPVSCILSRLVKAFDRIHKAVKTIEFFTTHDWDFPATNVGQLMQEMSVVDREVLSNTHRHVYPRTVLGHCLHI